MGIRWKQLSAEQFILQKLARLANVIPLLLIN